MSNGTMFDGSTEDFERQRRGTIQTAPPAPEHTTAPRKGGDELPELYVRVNVTTNSKGVNTDRTFSVTGRVSTPQMATLLEELSSVAEQQVQAEIRKLEQG